jgi:hypothetical protein
LDIEQHNILAQGCSAQYSMFRLLLLQLFVPKLLAQEKFIFDELVSYMWTHTLVPRVAASKARAPAPVTGKPLLLLLQVGTLLSGRYQPSDLAAGDRGCQGFVSRSFGCGFASLTANIAAS